MASTELADKIAKLLVSETTAPDLSSLFASIEKINHRLDKLESTERSFKSEISNSISSHPSLDKFNVAEAIADTIFDGRYKEKACTFEPSRPCDHCSMCNSRGF